MSKKVIFLHPDLGIGGAERLVVDAALALRNEGHSVGFVTSHHDKSHCFVETKDGSFPVTVVGDWLPRHIFGKCYALCAYIRMIYAALYILLFSDMPDVFFCDIVSACIPILKLSKIPVVYYCHFPDQLLSVRGGKLKQLYRIPLNWVEEKTTGCADIILVNSKFTRKVFYETFTTITKAPEVLYPSINTDFFDKARSATVTFAKVLGVDLPANSFIFLSINRYERKKNVSLAIKALTYLKKNLNESEWNRVRLILAGGYDNRVLENIEYHSELKDMSSELDVLDKIFFLKSPSDVEKLFLLQQCHCLLYTPSNEHFGIVPLEAMYSEKPVIAVNSGGPRETVVDNETGYLCEPNEEEFAAAMSKCLKDENNAKKMGRAGRKRFEDNFSFRAFSEHLISVIDKVGFDDYKQN
ncbi:alpha-1,3/1,6-mannosyltransferase ALG2 [Macrosteles quadrilineatus]|uniref:alpha-1,3/1,6-mannosyltransferase ALG2 n=1 Tax=Macrosteles quadrilineatus TaxID=74068 RepID=UPI0023E2FDB8|nr:alpha-1,3/1,6-mannosyltransferase ALG2 [Macrosteles quadrilineatus]